MDYRISEGEGGKTPTKQQHSDAKGCQRLLNTDNWERALCGVHVPAHTGEHMHIHTTDGPQGIKMTSSLRSTQTGRSKPFQTKK